MNLLELCNLQGALFLMILAGAILKRRGIISKEGEKCLTDLCVNIVIPCNIVKSCLISFDASIFKTCGLLLAVGFVLQLVCVALNKVLFKATRSSIGRCSNTARSFLTADFSEIRSQRVCMEAWDFSMRLFS